MIRNRDNMTTLWQADWFMINIATMVIIKDKFKRVQIVGEVLLKRKATKQQGT